nr:adenylate/guanylate cyclase domain-containing protein [Microvirga antarctica]
MAGLVAGLLLPLSLVPAFQLVDARVYDLLSTIMPARPAEPGAVIVAIDEPSFSEIGQRWPWSRALHARVLDELRAAGAKVVGFDIIFAEPSDPQADQALAKALGPDVVLAADDVTTGLEQGTQVTRVQPLDLFLDAGAAAGLTSVSLHGDAALRDVPRAPDSFAAEMLRKAGMAAAIPPLGALIQYFGPPRSYPTVSYYQALDPGTFLPPGTFKDRIVLVGLSLKASAAADSGAPDSFPTPYTLSTGSLTAGVEAQATILDNLLHGLYVVPVSRLTALGLVLAASLLGAFLCREGVNWRSGSSTLLLLAFWIIGSWALLRFGRVWAAPVLPVSATLLVVATRFGVDYARERRMRRAISTAFSRYLSPDLVAQLAADPSALKLGGERRNLTILFCDVRGFTSLSERLKDQPERLTSLINRLLDPLSEAVLAEGGTIDKYMGDCIMAFWNAPLPRPDHAARAVAAAARMMTAVTVLNRTLKDEEGDSAPVFAVGIGINSGDCVVGNVGSRWRYDYSVLGDTVNLASRLEGLSKEYGVSVILGPDTAEAVQAGHALIELDRIAVRGRASESAIYTVLHPGPGEADAFADLARQHALLMTALRAGDRAEALRLLALCAPVTPVLARYYDRLRARIPSDGDEQAVAAGGSA